MASQVNVFKDSVLYREFEWTLTCPALLKKVRRHVQGLMQKSGSKHQQSVEWGRVEFRDKSIVFPSKRARKTSAAYAWFKREVADEVGLHDAPRESHKFLPVPSSADGPASPPAPASPSAAVAPASASPAAAAADSPFPAFASLKLIRGTRVFPPVSRPRKIGSEKSSLRRGFGVTPLLGSPERDTSVPAVGSGRAVFSHGGRETRAIRQKLCGPVGSQVCQEVPSWSRDVR